MGDRVALVTGGSSGIGLATCEALGRAGYKVVMVCRDRIKAEVAQAIVERVANHPVDVRFCDLGDLEQVRALGRDVCADYDRLDVLVNTAGVWSDARVESADGLELTLAVNHLAPFVLTNALRELLEASAPARVVTVSSLMHRFGWMHFKDLNLKRRYNGVFAYAQSKLANILFTRELSRRLERTGVTANCLHPGLVDTNLGKDTSPLLTLAGMPVRWFLLSPAKGARTTVHLATAPELERATGLYFANSRLGRPSSAALRPEDARRLWDLSAEMTGVRS